MNWIRENKFLSGFIAVMVVGVAVFGYLLYSAYNDYSDVSEQYTAQAAKLNQLQSRTPYPDEDNLKKYQAELAKVSDATQALAANLAQMELPVEQITPAEFQDKLRASASAISAKAQQLGTKLPDHFFLGFDGYQSQPPRAEAATALGRELAAIETAINIVLDCHAESIAALNRPPLPEEQAGGAHAGGSGGGFGQHGRMGGGGGGGGGGGRGGLVEKTPFTLSFLATQSNFQKVLNTFGTYSKQFFIVRTLVVKNDNPKPVDKAAAAAAPDAGAAPAGGGTAPVAGQPAGAAPASPDGAYLKFIVGTEKLQASMQVDIVKFNPPGAPAGHHGGNH